METASFSVTASFFYVSQVDSDGTKGSHQKNEYAILKQTLGELNYHLETSFKGLERTT
jgi:hypothetical protein